MCSSHALPVSVKVNQRQIYLIADLLFAANNHAGNFESRGRRSPSEVQIVSDHLYVHQHVFQVACDSDLFDRKGQLAILNPGSGRTERKISINRVHAEPENIGQVQSILYRADYLLRGKRSGLYEKVVVPNMRRAG